MMWVTDNMKSTLSHFAFILLFIVITASGTTVYNRATELCCEGTPYLADNQVSYCCGNQLISDTSSYICCNGNIKSKPNPTKTICCGSEAIDNSVNACINGQSTPIPASDIAAGRTNVCIKSSIEYEFYNKQDEICCEGTLFDNVPQKTLCCGGQTFDITVSKCCNNKIIEVEGDALRTQCCGDSYYNLKTQNCCDGVPLYKNTSVTYSFCCGNQIYDFDSYACCDNQLIPIQDRSTEGCCGVQIYNPQTQYCCNNLPVDIPNDLSSYYCCVGRVFYESFNTRCCNGEAYQVNNTQNVCFVNEECTVYSTSDQVCCSDGIINLTEDDKNAKRTSCCY
ncbi:hypothetical protein CHUAL_006855 [Chamberlinius hualienensis]